MNEREIVERLAKTEGEYLVKEMYELRNNARALLKLDPDYASWVGELVEVSRDGINWQPRVLAGYRMSCDFNFCTLNPTGANVYWKFCRPYTTPLKLIFTPHDGGECPVGEDEWVIVKFRNGIKSMPVQSLNQGIKDGCYKPSDITGYVRIKL